MAALRNTLILSFLLGLGFILGFLPTKGSSTPQQYIFVFLNTSSGVFVFISSILINENITGSLRRSLSKQRFSIATLSSSLGRSDSRSNSWAGRGVKNQGKEVLNSNSNVCLSIQFFSHRIIMKIILGKEGGTRAPRRDVKYIDLCSVVLGKHVYYTKKWKILFVGSIPTKINFLVRSRVKRPVPSQNNQNCGAVWSSVEQCGAVWSSVEQNLFYIFS